jgi:hypothetical protein
MNPPIKKIWLLKPLDKSGLNNQIFNSPFGFLKQYLVEAGIDLKTYDMGNVEEAEKIIFFDHHEETLQQIKKRGGRQKEYILFLFEPRAVLPKQYSPQIFKKYSYVFTWRDDLVDNQKFYRFNWPQGQKKLDAIPPIQDRKLLTLINANKYSYTPGEIYSYRRKAIRFFEKTDISFDLYGPDWNKKYFLSKSGVRYLIMALQTLKGLTWLKDVFLNFIPYRSYRGVIQDKYKTLSGYQFCICFENEKNSPGYFTEKIFDCFFTGTIPIYLGASNVERYIPQDCYIDMRKFKNFKELQTFILNISLAEKTKIQQKGLAFIESDYFHQNWAAQGTFKQIVQKLIKL